jgi:hypothetical protein
LSAIRFVALLNGLAAVGIAALLATGGLGRLERGFPPLWQILLVAVPWVVGGAGLWSQRRWAWYLTLVASTIAALGVSTLCVMLLLFHGVPRLEDFGNVDAQALVLFPLASWGVVASLFHPAVSRRVRTTGLPGKS